MTISSKSQVTGLDFNNIKNEEKSKRKKKDCSHTSIFMTAARAKSFV